VDGFTVPNDWKHKAGVAWRRFQNREVNALRAAGDTARDRGDWTEAAAQYGAYVRKRPNDFGIWVQFGHALKESGAFDASARAYDEAMRLDPANADLLLNLGHLARKRGDLAEAAYRYRASYRIDANRFALGELMRGDLDPYLDAAERRLDAEEHERPLTGA
jgi:tetratricopeptide (TPR) repeat protein